MTAAAFPSERFPDLCRISIDIPDGWALDDVPGAFIAAFDLSSPAYFRTNALVAVTRTVSSLSVEACSEQFLVDAEADPTFTSLGEELAVVDGRPAALRLQSRRVQALELFQAQALILVPTATGASADLVQLHATCAADVSEVNAPRFRDLIDSLTLAPAG